MSNSTPWTREEHEILVYDTEDGVTRRATAHKLNRTVAAVRRYAGEHGILYPVPVSEEVALRERWEQLLPKLKAALVNDIQKELAHD